MYFLSLYLEVLMFDLNHVLLFPSESVSAHMHLILKLFDIAESTISAETLEKVKKRAQSAALRELGGAGKKRSDAHEQRRFMTRFSHCLKVIWCRIDEYI